MTAFYSPSGEDGYVRPKINYQLDKNWAIESGVNWFFGESEQTFFGQLEDNSNVFLASAITSRIHKRYFVYPPLVWRNLPKHWRNYSSQLTVTPQPA